MQVKEPIVQKDPSKGNERHKRLIGEHVEKLNKLWAIVWSNWDLSLDQASLN